MVEGVAGGCLTQPPGEDGMEWPPEKTLAWTHRRSFTLGVREDRYGQVGSVLRDGRVVEEQRVAIGGGGGSCWSALGSIWFFFPIDVKKLSSTVNWCLPILSSNGRFLQRLFGC